MNKLKTILIKGQVIFPGEIIGFSASDREKLKVQLEAYENNEELLLLDSNQMMSWKERIVHSLRLMVL